MRGRSKAAKVDKHTRAPVRRRLGARPTGAAMSAPQFSANTHSDRPADNGSTRTALRLSAIGLFGLCGAGLALSLSSLVNFIQMPLATGIYIALTAIRVIMFILVAIELYRAVRSLAKRHNAGASHTVRILQPRARNILIIFVVARVLTLVISNQSEASPLASLWFVLPFAIGSSSFIWLVTLSLLSYIVVPFLPALAAASVYVLLRRRTQGRAAGVAPRILMAIPVVVTLILLATQIYLEITGPVDPYQSSLLFSAYSLPLGFAAIRCATFAVGYWAIHRASSPSAESDTSINLHTFVRPLIYIGVGIIAHSTVAAYTLTEAVIMGELQLGFFEIPGIITSLDFSLAGIGLLFLALALVLRSWPEPIGPTAPWQEQPQ